MLTLIEYMELKGVQMLLVFIQNTLVHALLLSVKFTFLDIKVPVKKHLKCAALIALVYFLPMYVIDFLFYYPAFFTTTVYTMFIFDDPVSVILYYFIIKSIFKFSSTRTSIIMRTQLLTHYIVVLVYLFFFNSLASIKGVTELSPGVYLQDLASILIVMTLLAIGNIVVKQLCKRSGKYIVIPPNYFENNIPLKVAGTIFSIAVIYVLMVVFRVNWLAENSAAMSLMTAFIYGILIAVLALYLRISISTLIKKLLDWEMQATDTYISSLLHVNQEFRAIKHDFNNVLQVYAGYLFIEDYEGLKNYHQQLFRTTKSAGDFLSLIEILKSRIAVYSLLETKSQRADSLDVEFSINKVCEITNVIISDFDLCRVLGNVIDNAIESASKSENKQVNISFEKKNEETIVFIISNTTYEDVQVNQLFNTGYTTKDGHSGIGLTQVMHILNSYEHCSYRVSYHENQFTIFLILNAVILNT